jgi:hypothetical protein
VSDFGLGAVFARLKQSVLGDAGPSTGLSDSEVIGFVNNYKLLEKYKDRPDEEKLAFVAHAARIAESDPFKLYGDSIGRLLETFKLLDLHGARIIFRFAASSHSGTRSLRLKSLARVMEKQPAGTFNDAALRRYFERMKTFLGTYDTGHASHFEGSELARRFESLIGATPMFSSNDPNDWSGTAIPGIGKLAAVRFDGGQTLDAFLRGNDKAKPSAKWTAPAAELAKGPQGRTIRQAIIDWLATLELPNAAARAGRYVNVSDPAHLSQVASFMVRSACFMLANWRDTEVVAALQNTAQAGLVKLSTGSNGLNYRSLTAANAAILALGEIATPEAVQALGRIKLKVRDERLVRQITAAMEAAAASADMSVADLQEIAVPTFGLTEVGKKVVPLGEFSAVLRVQSTTDAAISFLRADGKVVKSVPAAVKADPAAGEALKELKANVKAIAEALPVQRQRIEQLYFTDRTWPLKVWRERYLDHPLTGTLARRLIWTFTSGGTTRALMWHLGELIDASGNAVTVSEDSTVALWHPLDADAREVAAWRALLVKHRFVQPFKQAHRELYPLTEAERNTAIYSNRFAGHILRQHQSAALGRLRGWRVTLRIWADVSNSAPTHLRIPDFGLAGEFWTEGAGGDHPEVTDDSAYVFILTDRVRFRRYTDGELGDGVALIDVPPRVFSEVMRDVDLFVGVASIGNDPGWSDGGAEAEHPSQWRRTTARTYWENYHAALEGAGENRRELLAAILPSLAIADRCSIDGRYLTVRGKLGTYRIHIGSGNILMEDNRYLCIVPDADRWDGNSSDKFIPFEGDRTFSYILSKAFMLAADDNIKDKTILSQLGR